MESNRKTAGALIGAVGAQVLVIGSFLVFGETCCADQLVCASTSKCLFGLEMFAYWASVGSIATAVFVVIGALVAGES